MKATTANRGFVLLQKAWLKKGLKKALLKIDGLYDDDENASRIATEYFKEIGTLAEAGKGE